MNDHELSGSQMEQVAGGADADTEFYNTCTKCGKKWDMREYGYGEQAMPDWVTGNLCPECYKTQRSDVSLSINENDRQFYKTCIKCGKKWDMRKYGYGMKAFPNWVTGNLCLECINKEGVSNI